MSFHHFTADQLFPLLISFPFLLGAILLFQLGKLNISILFLFLGTLILGFFMANLDPFLILWDEQYHAMVAKNLATQPFKPMLYKHPLIAYDFKNWTSNHIWLHKQPFFLWQMAFSIKLFGNNEIAVRLPSIIMHALTTIMIFRIGKIAVNQNVGFYGALFFALAYYPLELIAGRYSTDHNDVAFLCYVTASFWAWFEYQRSKKLSYLICIGLFAGIAVLVKWLVGLLVYAVWFISMFASNPKQLLNIKSYLPLLLSFSISLLTFLPWQIFILHQYPLEANYEFAFNTRHFFEPLEGHGGDIWFHIQAFKEIYGSGFIIPFIYLLGFVILLKNCSQKIYQLSIISAFLIIYIFYSLAATKMISFCIIVSPFFFLGLGALFDQGYQLLKLKLQNRTILNVIFSSIAIVTCMFLLNLQKIQNYHTDWKPTDNCNRADELAQMKFIETLIKELGTEKFVVFNADIRAQGHISVMFYTNYVAYNTIPSLAEIENIKRQGYKIAILDKQNLPDYIESNYEIVKFNSLDFK